MAEHVEGRECRHCGTTTKWAYGGCVKCSKDRSRVWKRNNKAKVAEYSAAYHRKHSARILANHRRNRGISAPTRECPELCEMCGLAPSRSMNLDHCHATNAFRGWLCWDCNVALGKLGDSIDVAIGRLNHYRKIISGTN